MFRVYFLVNIYMFNVITLYTTRIGFKLKSDGLFITVCVFTLADKIKDTKWKNCEFDAVSYRYIIYIYFIYINSL